jgi:hypothetical protein
MTGKHVDGRFKKNPIPKLKVIKFQKEGRRETGFWKSGSFYFEFSLRDNQLITLESKNKKAFTIDNNI